MRSMFLGFAAALLAFSSANSAQVTLEARALQLSQRADDTVRPMPHVSYQYYRIDSKPLTPKERVAAEGTVAQCIEMLYRLMPINALDSYPSRLAAFKARTLEIRDCADVRLKGLTADSATGEFVGIQVLVMTDY
jgi:hypothetical protein